MKLRYKAQKADGSFYESERESADKYALARDLRTSGETLIHALESGESGGGKKFDIKALFPFLGRVSIHDKITFSRNLGGMLSAGLTVSRALNVLERQTRSEKFKKIISELSGRISTGESLSQAFSGTGGVFPPLVISMVKAGEEGGNLATSLFSVSEQMDRMYVLQRKVRGALIYPGVVVTVMAAVGIVLLTYVVPQLTSAFKEFNIQLPFTTRVVVGVSDFLHAHILVGLLGVVCVAGIFWVAIKSAKGKRLFDGLLLHIPIITPIIKEANAARTGQTLSSLLSSGVEVVNALDITADVLTNSYYKDVLLLARGAIQRGEPMSGVFREHETIFPPFLSEMIAVGEETGKLSPMLKETGAFFEEEVDQKTKNISTLIEPVLMVVVGVAVGFFAVAMISPAYSLMSSI